MTPPGIMDDDRAVVATEASEVQIALGGALDEAGIKLPQFAVARDKDDYLIRLGYCNVVTGMKLRNLILDGLTLRLLHPEDSVNAR